MYYMLQTALACYVISILIITFTELSNCKDISKKKEKKTMNKRYELNARINYDGAPDFTDEVERGICEGDVYAESEAAAIEAGINSLIGNIKANGFRAESDGESVAVYNEDDELVETYYDFSVTQIK